MLKLKKIHINLFFLTLAAEVNHMNILSQEKIESVIKAFIHLFNYRIDFTNKDGVVFASSNKEIIGTSLNLAQKAFIEEKNIIAPDNQNSEITADNIDSNTIYSPINLNNMFVCVVVVHNCIIASDLIIKIAHSYMDLLFNEEKTRVFDIRDRSFRNFGRSLVSELYNNKYENVLSNARLLAYAENKPRLILAVDLSKEFNHRYPSPSEFDIQNYHEYIYHSFSVYLTGRHIFFQYNEEIYILIYEIPKEQIFNINEIYNAFLKFTTEKITIGVGSLVNKFKDYNSSFNLALYALEYGKLLNPNTKIHVWNDYKAQMLILTGNDNIKDELLKSSSEILEYFNKNKDIEETIIAFFESGTNINKTAKKLHFHKNTILYRLNKFKADSNIDIFNAKNCADLYTLIILFKERKLFNNRLSNEKYT
jgi:carbohydrate diacid regulator